MIDPKLLTPQNGFVEGEDVKIRHRHSEGDFDVTGKLVKVNSRGVVIEVPLVSKGGVTVLFSDILAIRPLTGDMAIWNFAPEWANSCDLSPPEFFVTMIGGYSRPFWAKEKS